MGLKTSIHCVAFFPFFRLTTDHMITGIALTKNDHQLFRPQISDENQKVRSRENIKLHGNTAIQEYHKQATKSGDCQSFVLGKQ